MIRSLGVALPLALTGCFLVHGAEDEGPPTTAGDAGAMPDAASASPDASTPVSPDASTPVRDPRCPSASHWRLACSEPERLASLPINEADTTAPPRIEASVVDGGKLHVLVGEPIYLGHHYTLFTLNLETGVLERSEPWATASAVPYVRGGWLHADAHGATAVVASARDFATEGTTTALTAVPTVLRWSSSGALVEATELDALEMGCPRQCSAAITGVSGSVAVVSPAAADRSLEVSTFGLDTLEMTTRDVDVTTRTYGAELDARMLEGGGLVVAGGAGRVDYPPFAMLVPPDGSPTELDTGGHALDPPPLVTSGPEPGSYFLVEHETDPGDTHDRSLLVWEGTGASLSLRAHLDTPGSSPPLAMSATFDPDTGPVVAWSERAPGSITDSVIRVMPGIPPAATCAGVRGDALVRLRASARAPSVRAVAVDGDIYVFTFADRSEMYVGDLVFGVMRTHCRFEPIE